MALGTLRFRVDFIEVRRGPGLAPDDRERRSGIHLTIREETISLLDEALHSCASGVERSGRQVQVCASAKSTAGFDGSDFKFWRWLLRLRLDAGNTHNANCERDRYGCHCGNGQGYS